MKYMEENTNKTVKTNGVTSNIECDKGNIPAII